MTQNERTTENWRNKQSLPIIVCVRISVLFTVFTRARETVPFALRTKDRADFCIQTIQIKCIPFNFFSTLYEPTREKNWSDKSCENRCCFCMYWRWQWWWSHFVKFRSNDSYVQTTNIFEIRVLTKCETFDMYCVLHTCTRIACPIHLKQKKSNCTRKLRLIHWKPKNKTFTQAIVEIKHDCRLNDTKRNFLYFYINVSSHAKKTTSKQNSLYIEK